MNSEILGRDILTTMKCMALYITNRSATEPDEVVPAMKEAVKELAKNHIKPSRSRVFYFPKGTPTNLDGKFWSYKKLHNNIYIMPVIIDNKWELILLICRKLLTSYGAVWFCVYRNVTNFGKNMNKTYYKVKDISAVLVKEHALERVVERSPIKNKDDALPAILWSILKGELLEGYKDTGVVGPSESGELLPIQFDASDCTYNYYGKVVGTRFFVKGIKCSEKDRDKCFVVVNTYLDGNMVASA